jgi:hypothetical protein
VFSGMVLPQVAFGEVSKLHSASSVSFFMLHVALCLLTFLTSKDVLKLQLFFSGHFVIGSFLVLNKSSAFFFLRLPSAWVGCKQTPTSSWSH